MALSKEQQNPKEQPTMPSWKADDWEKRGFLLLISSKLNEAVKGIEDLMKKDSEKKTIIFIVFLEGCKLLDKILKQRKIEHVVFTGKLHAPEKGNIHETFRSKASYKIMVMSIMAGSKSVIHKFCDSS